MLEMLDRAASGTGADALGTDQRSAGEGAEGIDRALARTEPMRANVLRDAQTMPELAALLEGSVVPYLGAVRDLLAKGWEVRGKKRRRLLTTLALALDFHTWRSLERGSDLCREEAVEIRLETVRYSASSQIVP